MRRRPGAPGCAALAALAVLFAPAGSAEQTGSGAGAGPAAPAVETAPSPPATPASPAQPPDVSLEPGAPQLLFVSPAPGRVAFGPTRIEVTILPPDLPVQQVEFTVDGALVGVDRERPYTADWDAGFGFDSRRIEAVARLAGGPALRSEIETARVALHERLRVEAEPHDYVEITFIVTDRDERPVRGLAQRDFRLEVDRRSTPLAAFAEERRTGTLEVVRPLSIVLLLDISRSMREVERERFLLGAQKVLDRLRRGDEMMIMTFANDYQMVSDFTSDPRRLREALESIPRPDKGTNLYDALDESLERLSERHGRRVVIIYSDGQVTVGRSSLTATPASLNVLDQTRRAPIVLYWVIPHFQDATRAQRSRGLSNLATGSGGRWLLETEGIEKALDDIGEELQSQYYAAFYVDRQEHQRPSYDIDLEARSSGLRVQAPQVVSGSGPILRRLEKMLASDDVEERAAAAVQLPRLGYEQAYLPLVRRYRREKDPGVRDTILAAILAAAGEEWKALGGSAEGKDAAERLSRQRRLERQIRALDDPRALALLDTLDRD
jgi:VWFA-related protein